MYKINHETKNHYEFMAVIDDVPDKREDLEMKRLMTIYRNSRISCIVCAQTATMVNKMARSNINWVLLGRMNSSSEVERNIKDYLQGIIDKKPKRKIVAEYFKNRVKELTATKMK